MLFAHPALRDYIAARLVPAWESVRAVPTVTIDFGGGRTLKRTLNGNVAAYVCAPDGRVVDILPGLSTPEAYLADLRAAVALAERPAEDVRKLHLLRASPPAPAGGLDAGKRMGIEPRVKRAAGVDRAKKEGIEPAVKGALLDRALLESDTVTNREQRKPKIHALLGERSWTPAELTRRVYRDVLDCDLDDPYLGLGEAAFGGGAYASR